MYACVYMHTIKADEKCEHITGDWSGFFYVSYFVTTDDEGTKAHTHSLKTGKSITCSVENCIYENLFHKTS